MTILCGELSCTRLSSPRSRREVFLFMKWMREWLAHGCRRTMTFISMSRVIHSPATVPFIVRVHFTVMRDHARYCDVKAWVGGPGFFQPTTNSVLTSFLYRHPPTCSLTGLNRIQRVNHLTPCMLIVRDRRKGCRLPAWPSLQSGVLLADTTFL